MITHDQAMAAVERFDCILYFNQLSSTARAEIAELLMKLVNDPVRRSRPGYWIDEEFFPGEPIPYVDPKDRLEWLVQAMINNVAAWPGPMELRAIYCRRFLPADGQTVQSELPGFTAEEIEAGCAASCLSAPVAQQAYLPQPGDEPVGALAGEVMAVAVQKRRR